MFRSGKVSSGTVRQVWNVVVRLGSEGYGVVKQGRCGSAWFCAMRYGMVSSGTVRQVAHGVER